MSEITFSVKITSINTVHVHFRLFSGKASRGACGDEQCMRVDEFEAFCKRLKPELVTFAAAVPGDVIVPHWLKPWIKNPWGYKDAYRIG